jgi:hypothetical protein
MEPDLSSTKSTSVGDFTVSDVCIPQFASAVGEAGVALVVLLKPASGKRIVEAALDAEVPVVPPLLLVATPIAPIGSEASSQPMSESPKTQVAIVMCFIFVPNGIKVLIC